MTRIRKGKGKQGDRGMEIGEGRNGVKSGEL